MKLDIGCGPNKKEGFIGVDEIAFPGVDVVMDIRQPWPWKENEVEEVHCSHFLEHLEGIERVHFFNELYRVLKPDGKAVIITPHWASMRAYGDVTHKWPPVCEFFYLYLSKEWRAGNAPHSPGYTCDFTTQTNPTIHPAIIPRNAEFQAHAMLFYKEAAQDLVAIVKANK